MEVWQSQHGAIFIVILLWPRRISLGVASVSSWGWWHQVWVAQCWCPLSLQKFKISALLQVVLPHLNALFFHMCIFSLFYLYLSTEVLNWTEVQIISASRQLYLISISIHSLPDVSSWCDLHGCSRTSLKNSPLHGVRSHPDMLKQCHIFHSVPNLKKFIRKELFLPYF